MDVEYKFGLMGQYMKDFGKMGRNLGMEDLFLGKI